MQASRAQCLHAQMTGLVQLSLCAKESCVLAVRKVRNRNPASASAIVQVDNKGNAFQYTALATRDMLKTAEAIKKAGAPIVREVGYLPGTELGSIVTQDPSGWKFVFVSEEDYFKDIKERQQVQ